MRYFDMDFLFFIAASDSQAAILVLLFFYFVVLTIFLILVHSLFNISREIFDFSRLVSLFAHSAQSAFRQQLRIKAMQKEESHF